MATAIAIPQIMEEHASEAAGLWDSRDHLLRAPDVKLEGIARMDERIDAHLDGLAVAGAGESATTELLAQDPGCGEVFVAAAVALNANRAELLEQTLTLAGESTGLRRGLHGAFGWTPAHRLRGVVADLLRVDDGKRRLVGLTACAMHRVDPGITSLVQDPDAILRARAFRAAGELGLQQLVSLCARSTMDEDPHCAFWAGWAAVVLGDRESALPQLQASVEMSPFFSRVFPLVLQASDITAGHAFLQSLAADPAMQRQVIRGTGHVGDPRYIPMLIGHMADDKLARLAGESFSMITGLDLSRPPFYRPQFENVESAPDEDPEDENVDMDQDDGLPWPDQFKVQAWWNQNGARFTTGVRHFIGAPPNRTHCIEVLKNGYQRQRVAAAYHLCLLNPGTPLFEWRAPAWRQQRELAQMS